MKRLLKGIALILNVALNIAAGWTFIGLVLGMIGALPVFFPDKKSRPANRLSGILLLHMMLSS